MKKGFVTLATGNDHFYHIAANLLKSYRHFTSKPLPFAIVCDRKNSFTEAFDDVIVLENATCSYMDKLSLLKLIPYEETVFVDADCLAYGDLNVLFDMFIESDDLSCFGKVLPLDSKDGFFNIENIGAYAEKISFCVGIHGGIMFFRKSDILNKVYDTCCEIRDHYYEYKFRYFRNPADEPLIALSMALYNLHPTEASTPAFAYYPVDRNSMYFDILNAKATFEIDGIKHNILVVHFSSIITKERIYQLEEENLNLLCNGKAPGNSLRAFFKPYRFSLFADNMRKRYNRWLYNTKCKVKPVVMKILRRK